MNGEYHAVINLSEYFSWCRTCDKLNREYFLHLKFMLKYYLEFFFSSKCQDAITKFYIFIVKMFTDFPLVLTPERSTKTTKEKLSNSFIFCLLHLA